MAGGLEPHLSQAQPAVLTSPSCIRELAREPQVSDRSPMSHAHMG